MFDKDKIKNNLTIEQIKKILEYFGGEPCFIKKDVLISETICHNDKGCSNSKKLYYYDNSKLFKCYTECDDIFDIFELIIKVKKIQENENWDLTKAEQYIVKFFNIDTKEKHNFEIRYKTKDDLDYINKISLIEKTNKENYKYKIYSDKELNNLNFIPSIEWLKEGITIDTMKRYGIKYYGKEHKIVIPHYNKDNMLIGIRGRSMISEDVERYGKYMPITLNGKMYNHPLSYNLYGLNHNLKNIEKYGRAILFESEKSVMLYDSFFGEDYNVALATCGHSLTLYQIDILKSIKGLKEVILAYDKQFKELGDKEYTKDVNLALKITEKLKINFNTSIIFDKFGKLEYKDAPIDKGKETFEFLFNNKIVV